ncbi:MAG: 5'-deoxynucleotidase, partial [Clostridia bacterium]|nr:5'-deoxynucleotidase [Clostridia bacterium]
WGLMHNDREENLMEHSFETAVIAGALANIENNMFGGDYDVDRITQAALFHDASEIITGDMPTPVKYINSQMSDVYKEVEAKAQEALLHSLPNSLEPVYEDYFEPDERSRQIIKAADKISALLKCIQECRVGNKDFETAWQSTEEKIRGIELESVKYFMDNMLPAYTMTLDELSVL